MGAVAARRSKVDEEEVLLLSNVVMVGSCGAKSAVIIVVAMRCALAARPKSCCWFVSPLELLYRFYADFFFFTCFCISLQHDPFYTYFL